mmetsp:Transcript_24043/g.36673  ORF Transcript_24043/g.36673 Transcript_24043/m.36673 type:complete len:97 (+) Transcript_24043:251-541(+)
MIILLVCFIAFDNASTTTFSLSESSAAVGSSKRRTPGLRISARAIATRCLWPPDKVLPPSPTLVSSSSPMQFLADPSIGRPATASTSATAERHFLL